MAGGQPEDQRGKESADFIIAFIAGVLGLLTVFFNSVSLARVVGTAFLAFAAALTLARGRRWLIKHLGTSGDIVNRVSTRRLAVVISVLAVAGALLFVENPHSQSPKNTRSTNARTLTPIPTPIVTSKPSPAAFDFSNPIRATVVQVGHDPFALAADGPLVWVANSDDNSVGQVDTRSGRQNFTVKVGRNPVAVAVGLGATWVASSKDGTISKVNSRTRTATTIHVGTSPATISIIGQDLWVSDINENVVREISPSGTVRQTVKVGQGPIGQTVGGGYLWIADASDQTIWRIDPMGKEQPAHVDLHMNLLELAYAGDGLWATAGDDDKVVRLDPATLQVTDKLDVPDFPLGIATDGQSVWVTSQNADEVAQIDVGTRQLGSIVPVPNQPLAVVANDGIVTVAQQKGDSLTLLVASSIGANPSRQAVLTSSYVSASPVGIVAAFGSIWISNGDAGTISRIDPGTFKQLAVISLGGQELAVSANSKYIWTADAHSNRVFRIDPKTNRVAGMVPVKTDPRYLLATESEVWVSEYGTNTIEELDPTSMKVVRTVPVLDGPLSLAIGDGSVWVTESAVDKVARINELSGNIEDQIPVGKTPGLGIAVTASNVWVTSNGDGKLTQINPATNGVVGTRAVVQQAGDLLLDGDYIWITSVAKVDSKLIRFPADGSSPPQSLQIDKYAQRLIKAAGSYWLACTESGTVERLDPPTNT